MRFIIMFFLLLFLMPFFKLQAQDVDLSRYQRRQFTEKIPYMANMDFQNNAKGWKYGKGFIWEKGIGINGTGGLRASIDNPETRSRTTRMFYLQPGSSYKLTYYVKVIKKVVNNKKGKIYNKFRPGYIEFLKGPGKKNYLGWLSPGLITNDPSIGWQLSETKFTVPSKATRTFFSLWLHSWGCTGEAVFDNVNITPADSNSVAFLTSPAYNIINPKGDELKIHIFTDSHQEKELYKNNDALVLLKLPEKTQQFHTKIKDCFIRLNTGKMPRGKGILEISIINHDKKIIYATYTIPVEVKEKSNPLVGAVCFDKYNRTWIDGQLFMPLGVYISTNTIKKDAGWGFAREMNIIGKSPFNTILDYGSHRWHVKGGMKKADICAENNLKFIMSVAKYDTPGKVGKRTNMAKKLVKLYKNHRALLSWYLSDELPIARIPQIFERRKWINQRDPFHPTYLVNHVPLNTPYYSAATDIIGCDSYPMRKKDAPRDIRKVLNDSRRIEETQKVAWNVPQICSQGTYLERGKNYHAYIEPSVKEMRAMYLLMANHGARGFIAYARHRLYKHKEARKNYDKTWADVCKVVQVIKEQKNYIMSKAGPKKVRIKINSGATDAKEYISDNGTKRVFIVSLKAGNNNTEIVVKSDTPMKSMFGLTTHLEGHKYLFKASGIDSDILY